MKRYLISFTLLRKVARAFSILMNQGIHVFLRVTFSRLVSLRNNAHEAVSLADRFETWESAAGNSEQFQVSIVIPVFNGGSSLQYLLNSLRLQKGVRKEIILVDSGSDDGSLNRYFDDPLVRIIRIVPGSFSHSSARNIGVNAAVLDQVLLTVQDAEVPDDLWLLRLCQMQAHLDTVALSVAEAPKGFDDLYAAFAVYSYNKSIFKEKKVTLISSGLHRTRQARRESAAIGNVACLYRRETLEKFPFQGSFGEDLTLGLRLLQAGFKLGKTSELFIWHSHNRSSFYWLKRNYASRKLLIELELDDGLVLAGKSANSLFSLLTGFLDVVGEFAEQQSGVVGSEHAKSSDHILLGYEVIALFDPALIGFLTATVGSQASWLPSRDEFSGLEVDLHSFLSHNPVVEKQRDVVLVLFLKAAAARLGWILGGVSLPVAEENSHLVSLLRSLSHGV